MSKNKKPKIKKTILLHDTESLQREFYNGYRPEYWYYKIHLLYNSYINYDSIKNSLDIDFKDEDDENYFKRLLRTEMHFLYFQILEALFKLIFAVKEHNQQVWLALSFGEKDETHFFSHTYKEIEKLVSTEGIKVFVNENIKLNKGQTINSCDWIFYFIHDLDAWLSKDELKKNKKNIESFLQTFAKDFTDRGEYNAFKHGLRFYNSSSEVSFGEEGAIPTSFGKHEDTITYLEKYAKDQDEKYMRVSRVSKSFDFERDYRMCLVAYELIFNIFYSRKKLIPEHMEKDNKVTLYFFHELNPFDVKKQNISLFNFSMTV